MVSDEELGDVVVSGVEQPAAAARVVSDEIGEIVEFVLTYPVIVASFIGKLHVPFTLLLAPDYWYGVDAY